MSVCLPPSIALENTRGWWYSLGPVKVFMGKKILIKKHVIVRVALAVKQTL